MKYPWRMWLTQWFGALFIGMAVGWWKPYGTWPATFAVSLAFVVLWNVLVLAGAVVLEVRAARRPLIRVYDEGGHAGEGKA